MYFAKKITCGRERVRDDEIFVHMNDTQRTKNLIDA